MKIERLEGLLRAEVEMQAEIAAVQERLEGQALDLAGLEDVRRRLEGIRARRAVLPA